jgi:lipopolysaccharide export system protein LptA
MMRTILPGGFAAYAFMLAAVLALGPRAAHAQAPATSLATNFSANASKPIDIQANMLEIDDKKKTATFKGKVSATQGDFNMKANELTVIYTDAKSGGKDAGKSPLPGGGAQITRIKALGSVVITSKDNQQASGDSAVFKVKEQMVYLTGNVKVKQGQSVVGAENLTVNLAESTATFMPMGKRVSAVLNPNVQDGGDETSEGN